MDVTIELEVVPSISEVVVASGAEEEVKVVVVVSESVTVLVADLVVLLGEGKVEVSVDPA